MREARASENTNSSPLFSSHAAGAETVITADQAVRGGKVIQLKQVVDAAVAKCPSVRQVFVGARTGAQVKMGPKDIALDQVSKCVCVGGRERGGKRGEVVVRVLFSV